MDDFGLVKLRIALVCDQSYARLHICSARVLLGQHHEIRHKSFHQRIQPRSFDLGLIVAETEFRRQPISEQLARVAVVASELPCFLAVELPDVGLLVGIRTMKNVRRWPLWPDRDQAYADITELLGLLTPSH